MLGHLVQARRLINLLTTLARTTRLTYYSPLSTYYVLTTYYLLPTDYLVDGGELADGEHRGGAHLRARGVRVGASIA